MSLVLAIFLAVLFFCGLTVLFNWVRVKKWLKNNWKKFVSVLTVGGLVTGGVVLMRLDNPPPVGDMVVDAEAFIWVPSGGYGGMPHWEVNKTYVKQFLKDNFDWRLQSSDDDNIWVNANQFLKIKLDWLDDNNSYKVTLTLNTTGAPSSLFYRFDLACNKSLKDSFESDGYEWMLIVGANDTLDYTVLFNWSDIKSLVDNDKVTVSRGVTENRFWLRIKTVNRININKEFVVDPWYGVIAAAVTDSWEWDTEEGRNYAPNGAIRLNDSEYYATVCNGDTGSDADGFIRTFRVYNDNGTFKKTVIEIYEFDTTDGYYANILQIPGTDKYVVAYENITGAKVTVVTFKISAVDGDITTPVIDTQVLSYDGSRVRLLHVSGDVWVVAYTMTDDDGWMETVTVDDAGMISAVVDSEEFDTSYGFSPYLCGIDDDTIAVSYKSGSATGDYTLMTYNVSDAGLITDTPADTWVYEANPNNGASLVLRNLLAMNKIGNGVYAITYIDSVFDVYCKSLTINDAGDITASWIDTLMAVDGIDIYHIDTFIVNDPFVSSGGNGVMGATFSGGVTDYGYDGYIYTWNITSAGSMDASAIDSLEFDATDDTFLSKVIWVNQSWHLIVYTGAGADGWACTVMIETNWASPVASSPSPANNSIDQSLSPLCSITVSDMNGDNMDVTFASDVSGSWTNYQTNSSVANGTYYWLFTQANTGGTPYNWRVYVNDSFHNSSFDYSFTTRSNNTCPSGGNFTPANLSTDIVLSKTVTVAANDTDGNSLTVCFYENSTGSWKLRQVNNTVTANSTVYWVFSQANTASTTYWWNVTIADASCNVSYWLSYTTRENYTGPDYYVNGTSGSDTNNGSIYTPFKTINKGVNTTSNGGTTYIMAGTYTLAYNEQIQINNKNTASTWLTIRNYTNDYVEINGSWLENKSASYHINATIEIVNSAYVRITGLTLNWSGHGGITVFDAPCNNITIDNCSITNSCAHAVKLDNGMHDIILENCYIYDNFNNWATSYMSQETISFENIDGFSINNNSIINNRCSNIDVKGGCKNGEICYNEINTTGGYLFKVYDFWGATGIMLDARGISHNISIFNNYIYGNNSGLSLNTEDVGYYENISIFNNILDIANETGGGAPNINIGRAPVIVSNTGLSTSIFRDIYIYSNTITSGSDNEYNIFTINQLNTSTLRNIQIYNNLFYTDGTKNVLYFMNMMYIPLETPFAVVSNNSFYRPTGLIRCYWNGSSYTSADNPEKFGAHAIFTNPLFMNSATNDFHLNSTSPCINTGNTSLISVKDYDDLTRPQGAGYDIGAYEYLSANSVPTFSDETPTNNSVFSGITPDCYVVCNDVDIADTLTVDFYENTTGSYVWISGNTSVSPSSNIGFSFINADEYGTVYYWMVTSFDGTVNSSVIYSFTAQRPYDYIQGIRNTGEDYIIWLGDNSSAWNVSQQITGFDEALDWIAIWNGSTWDTTTGLWDEYYGDASGNNFTVNTFDVIRVNLTDLSEQNIYIWNNPNIDYDAVRTITLTNGSANYGYNYTGYTSNAGNTLSGINGTNVSLDAGESIGVWNNSTYTWVIYLPYFELNPDETVARWQVVETKVEDTETCTM